ncbi:MAG: MATE family efflux transporter [Candidatus Pacebacteria bacterium]|nr:MATE family efflux transporter [Candidatus Paceibacterota bacterium]
MEKINEESIWRQFLKLSIPIAIANFLASAYSITDAFWLGRLNSESLAAVSVCYPIIFLLISFGSGLFVSGTVMVSHHKGREDQEKIDHVSGQLITLMVFVSLAISIAGHFISPYLIKMIGAESLIPYGAVSFLQLYFWSIIAVFAFAVYQSMMRALGNVNLPLFIILSTVILNFIIDPIFIFGFGPIPAMGTVGAAVASIFCETINVLIAGWLVFSGRSGITIKWENLKPNKKEIMKILKVGVPSSMEQVLRSLGLFFVNILVVGFGTASIAAYGVGGNVMSLVMVLSLAFMMSTSIMVGRDIGAGRMERAEKVTESIAKISFWVLTVVGTIIFLLAEEIASIFTPGDPEVIRLSAGWIKIMALSFGFFGVQQIFNGTFIGAGDTVTSMVLSVFSFWILRLPVAFLLSRTPLGFYGVCLSFPVTMVLAALIGYLVFKSGRWKERRIRH